MVFCQAAILARYRYPLTKDLETGWERAGGHVIMTQHYFPQPMRIIRREDPLVSERMPPSAVVKQDRSRSI